MFVRMRAAARRSQQSQSSTESPASPMTSPGASQKEPPIPETDVPMQVDAALPPCELFENFLSGECSHGDSLMSPPHSASNDLSHLTETFGPQNIRRRNCPQDQEQQRPLYTVLDPKTKFDQSPCKLTAVCYAVNGDLLVADAGNAKIKRFDQKGQLKVEYSIPSNYGNSLVEPVGLCSLPSGEIVVADRGAGDLKVFTPEGHLLTTFGHDLTKPCDVTVNGQGHIIVVEETSNKIHIYPKIGKEGATVISADAKAPTTSTGPRTVTASKNGNVVVADENTKSIIIYDSFGKLLSVYNSEDSVSKGNVRRPMSLVSSYSLGHLKLPVSVVNDHHGDIFVMDGEHCRVAQFSLSKNIFLRELISREDGLSQPRRLAASPSGFLVVTEADSEVVKIYDARQILAW